MVFKDTQLLFRLRQGDVSALDTIYTKYRSRLLAAVISTRVDAHVAEDGLHDVFVSISARMPHVHVKSNLYAYLLTGVINGIRDRFRKTQRRAQSQPRSVHVPIAIDPQQKVIHDELNEQATQLLETLSFEQREVVALRVQTGLAFNEIAQLQGVSSSTVRGRYRYGISKLRKCVC
jgi:RNA polymerase sigma-70 factor (ECF subfamily)